MTSEKKIKMQKEPSNFTRFYAKFIIDQFIENNITHFFISPGMRNSPLIWAAIKNESAIVIDGIDERAHAYRSLGYNKATKNLSCLICTSGTALANYLPAVIEAYKTGNQLLIISADRPPKLINGNANQTIIQAGIFGHYSSAELNHHCENNQISFELLQTKLDKLIFTDPGAIHLNLGFEEPLDHSIFDINISNNDYSLEITKNLKSFEINNIIFDKKPLIVIGDHCENKEKILNLSHNFLKNIYADITSNIKFENTNELIPSFDHPEVFDYFKNNPPKQVIHIGGRVTSKKYYQYLNEEKDLSLITINNSHLNENPSGVKATKIDASAIEFFEYLNKKSITFEPIFAKRDLSEIINKKISLIDNSKLSYPSISKISVENLKDDINLVIGNSTYIRSFDYYTSVNNASLFHIFTNRGASGIEGLVALSQGVTFSNKPTVLFIGDISLLHDINSLSTINKSYSPLLIICANNNGGGIFDLLPISKDEKLLKHIVTEQNVNLKDICKGFAIDYLNIESKEEFKNSLHNWNQKPNNLFLDVTFSRKDNIEVYNSLRTMQL